MPGPGAPATPAMLPPANDPWGPAREPGPNPPDNPAFVRFTRNVAADNKPIVLRADTISTWLEEPYFVVRLSGQVLVNQSIIQLRCKNAIAWLDRNLNREKGLWHVQIYCEDDVMLDPSTVVMTGSRGLIDLFTRGEIKLVSHSKDVARQNLSTEPIALRAQQERATQLARQPAATATPILQTGGQRGPASFPAPGTPRPTGGWGAPSPQLPQPPQPLLRPGPPTVPAVAPGDSWNRGTFGGGLPPGTFPAGNPAPPAPGTPLPPGTPGPATPVPARGPTGPLGADGPVGPPENGSGGNPPATLSQQSGYLDVRSGGTGAASTAFPVSPVGDEPRLLPPIVSSPMPPPGNSGGNTCVPAPPAGSVDYSNPVTPFGIQQVQATTPLPLGPPGGGPPPGVLPGPVPAPPSSGSVVPPTPLPPPSRQATPPSPPPPPGPRSYTISPSRATPFQVTPGKGPNGESVVIITGGVKISVRGTAGVGVLDIEADNAILFTRTLDPRVIMENMRGNNKNDLEFYLSGNVEIRETAPPDPKNPNVNESKTLKANEVYYDVNRNVAVAVTATLELKSDIKQQGTGQPILTEPAFVKAKEILRLSETKFEVYEADIFSSKLPSDPGLKISFAKALIEETTRPKKWFFRLFPVIDPLTGQPVEEKATLVKATDAYFEFDNIPFFYLPYLSMNARDPLGPVNNFMLGYNRIFGFSSGISFDVFKLLGIRRPPNQRLRLDLDYLSARGPAAAYRWNFGDSTFFGLPATVSGLSRGYVIHDQGQDILGGTRETNNPPNYPAFNPPGVRGRMLLRESILDLPEGFSVLFQIHYLSDRNFLEQYFKNEFDNDLPPQTYFYAKQSPLDTNWAWTVETTAHIRSWINETVWLPKFDGYLIGASPLDNLLTYSAWGDLANAQLRISTDPEPQVSPTDRPDYTGRVNLMQQLSMPVQVGDVKLVPFFYLSLGDYTRNLNDQNAGRVWGATGACASLPMSHLYADACSELLNVNGINHKIVFGMNAFFSRTNVQYQNLPQLDRLNDDATDMALRDIRPDFPLLYPNQANALLSPLMDPQTYAVRNLLLTRLDTLASTEVVQFDVRQRWQTKRGYPGLEHIIDWMTLDLYASFFPRATRTTSAATSPCCNTTGCGTSAIARRCSATAGTIRSPAERGCSTSAPTSPGRTGPPSP